MTWQSLGTITITSDWSFTSPVQGEIFRVKHHPITGYSADKFLKAAIAQSFVDEAQQVNIFDIRRLSYRNEAEILALYFPSGIGSQSICLKRLDTSPYTWQVDLEVFNLVNQVDDFNNYLISRFRELMPLFNSLSLPNNNSATATPTTVAVSTTSAVLLAANTARLGASIVNGANKALNVQFAATTSTSSYAVQIAAGGYYEVPYGYTGAISGVLASNGSGNALVTEFT
jgi:hypothetical protein